MVDIISETEDRIDFSNGDGVYAAVPKKLWSNRWCIDSRNRKEESELYYKNGGTGSYLTSWFLKATNKKDAIEEYKKILDNKLIV
jgi:nitrate/TMAO reductase-like tetraheme cytochrome c subunit